MPAFSRRRFQRIRIGNDVMIEVLETGSAITKLEITAPQGWRILRGERKLWKGQTMFRDAEELERAAAKKLQITHEELLERTRPEQLADIRDVNKPTKLIIERKQWESVKIGPDTYLQLIRAGKTLRMGIEKPDQARIEELDVSEERLATETMRRRQSTERHREWKEGGGMDRVRAKREQRQVA